MSRSATGVIALALSSLFVIPAQAQGIPARADSGALHAIIAERDSALFAAFNRCDTTAIAAFFTPDLEFYHDWNGLLGPRDRFVSGFSEGCRRGEIGRREVVPNTMEVYPMRNVGALQVGKHRFFVRDADGRERPGAIARYVMLWRNSDGTWRVSRVLSFDHRGQ